MQIVYLTGRLHEIMSTRAEKVLFVRGEPGTSYGDFIELVNAAYRETDVTSILTARVAAQARMSFCVLVSCGRCIGFSGSGESPR